MFARPWEGRLSQSADTPLILGASGFLGLNLVDAMRAAGDRPVAGVRRPSRQLNQRGVPVVPADLDDADGLVDAMRGHGVVIHAAGHYPRTSTNPTATMQHALGQQARVLDAAAAAGVKRLVYVSSTATVAPAASGPSTEADVYAAAPTHGVYHAVKWEMEQLARLEDRFEVVVACPSGCVGPWDLRIGTSALLVATARGWDPPHPDGFVNLVDARDVGRAIARLARMPTPPARVLLSTHTFRLHALLVDLARRYGARPPSPALTAGAARELADAEERRADHTGERPRISREIVDLVVHATPIDAAFSARTLEVARTAWEDTLTAWETWARLFGLVPRNTLEPSHDRTR